MKKTFLNKPQMSHLDRFSDRRTRMGFACYKTDGDPRTEEELLTEIQKRIDKSLETRATKEELSAIKLQLPDELKGLPIEQIRAMAHDTTGAMAVLAKQGLEIQRLKTTLAAQPEDMSIRSQIKKWMEQPIEEGSTILVRDAIKDIRAGRKRELPALEFELQHRVDSPMTPTTAYNGSAYLPKIEYAPGINEIVRPMPTFWDYLKKGTTGSASYVWINKKNPEGAAGFIAPGVAKPGISFQIGTEISNAKKIAASEKIATELLQDIDGMASWVEDELTYQVMQKASLTLMSNAGDTNTPTGIQHLSTTFTLTTVSTTSPNNWDCIRACVAQLRSGNLVGNVTCFLNPIDFANMVMSKAQNQGQLFIPPVTGATIVEDNNIPVGYVQIALLDYYKILIYKAFTMTYGWENDDFTKNLVTVIGEMRIHQMFSQNYTGAFIYDTFANITAAITKVVAP